MTDRDLRAIVVAYGGADDLDASLASLGAACPVTVVDNSSSDHVRVVATRHGAAYVDPGENLGFGRGVNVALGRLLDDGTPTDVLLLNPDARLDAATVACLADGLRSAGDVGAVAPRLVGDDGSEHRVLWPFPSPLRAWLDATGLGRAPARSQFAVGAVLMLRWEAVRDVGLFDERFFLYAEEADWQRRARAAGWRSMVVADALARHAGSGSSTDPMRREALFHAGQETYIRKWYGRGGWLAYRSAACAGALVRALVLPGARRSAAAHRAGLYLRGPRRAAGLGA